MRSRALTVFAALLYLGLALWAVRVVLPAPASLLPLPLRAVENGPHWEQLVRSDQDLTVALTTYNARTLATAPWRVTDGPQCYPLPNATALGEHMLGLGVRALPAYLLTRDPILTYNVTLILTFWIAAFAMYLLVHASTGSGGAALVAGLLFGFYPARLTDPAHLYVFGNQWTPLALLFAHRLFTRRGWWDAAGLVVFVGLQVIEGVYPMLALAFLGGTYGVYSMVRYARTIAPTVPKILVACVAIAAITAAVLLPYLRLRATWSGLSRPTTSLDELADFGWGGIAYPGSTVLALVAVALGDRLRGARRDDQRLVYLVGGLMVLWAAVRELPLPFGIRVPSLFILSARILPGLDAVRGGRAVGSGVIVSGAFLAGYGVKALTERLGATARVAVVGGVALAALAEIFVPAVARRSFAGVVEMRGVAARPPAELLDLYRRMGEGAVVDVPLDFGWAGFWRMGEHALLGAYHGRPIASCYNSFKTAVQDDVEALANRVCNDPRAGDALHALGFRTIVVHLLVPGRRNRAPTVPQPLPRHLDELGRGGAYALYRLQSDVPVVASFAALAGDGGRPVVTRVVPPAAEVTVTFENAAATTYRHPDPIEPTPLLARWYDAAGTEVATERLTALLPLALAGGDRSTRAIPMRVPATAGAYRVSLALLAAPDQVVGRAAVEVRMARAPTDEVAR